jgi:hypothetical protein
LNFALLNLHRDQERSTLPYLHLGKDAEGELEGGGEELWTSNKAGVAPLREKGERGKNFVKEEEW